jgi:hypothetical protein
LIAAHISIKEKAGIHCIFLDLERLQGTAKFLRAYSNELARLTNLV